MKTVWKDVTVGDILKLEYGKSLDKDHRKPNGQYPAFGANGIKDYSDKYLYDKPSIIVGRKGSAGEVNLTTGKFWPLDVTYYVTCDETEHDLMFLYYLLILMDLPKLAKGVKPGINRNDVYSISTKIPPLLDQKRIARILDEAFTNIEKARDNTEKNLENAKALFESYLNKVFTKRGKGWKEKQLGEVIKLEYGKELNKVERSANGKYPVYGANGIKEWSDKYYHNKQSVIVGRKGSAGEINLSEKKFWPLDVTYFITFNEKEYDLNFLYYLLKSLGLPKLAKGVKPGINRNDVYSLPVYVPCYEEQKNIVNAVEKLNNKTRSLELIYQEKSKTIEYLKKSLLNQALSGKL